MVGRHKQQKQRRKRADTNALENDARSLVQMQRATQKSEFQDSVLQQPCNGEGTTGLEGDSAHASGFPHGTKESWSGISGERGATPEVRRHYGFLVDR